MNAATRHCRESVGDEMRRRRHRFVSWFLLCGCCWCFCGTAVAATREVAKAVAEGNASYAAGDYNAAIEKYKMAEIECPDCPELAYNSGLAYYRLRDFEKANELFNEALSTRDLGLEARAKFNLGNVAYSQALEKMSALPEAIEFAQRAIDRYRDSLELSPEDVDARVNIEMAQLLVKDLLDKQKKQQEEQQQQDNQQQQENQQQQQENQQCENPQQQEGEGEKEEQQDKQEQKQGDSEKQEGQGQEQQQQQSSQEQEEQESEERQQASARQEEISPEQAEQMLQAVRDKEAERRAEKARRKTARRAPVSRDW